MKQRFFKLRNTAAVLTLSGLLITASVPALANDKKADKSSVQPVETSVSKLSTDQDGSTFLVKVNADAPVKFEISVRDKNGETLYSEVFEGESFSKPFKLMNDKNGALNVSLNIKNLTNGKVSTYNVNSVEKTVSAVTVKKS